MATITVGKIESRGADASPKRSWTSFFKNAYDAIVEAQELRAQTYVNGYLAHLTDDELARLGMTRDQMVRRTRNMMTSL
ncbi:hypothetical protein E8L99_10190 [Phreatobacter aquaticus]|uniref:DUF1127 domain-containing protein n=1 Tax=Phreatobacter aquaticus TaxID=2570229 RepID=A0A4D7QGQ6_9HYPH|nr:hypothetical protein [Phreatobacter aquaticus]QCK86095.1 hypothetical protein E8L99_10190 [Phreatobacter aquaticus]